MGSFIFAYGGHDEAFGNHPLECTLRSYSCSENRISRSDLGNGFINLSFWKSSNEKECSKHFASIENLSFMSRLFYREEILGQINLIQKKLLEPGIGLDVCVSHIDEAKIFFNRNRDRLVSESFNQSKIKVRENGNSNWKADKKRKLSGERKMMYVKHLWTK